MSTNVFGNPVTDTTVKLLYPNIREVTARHRAEVAMEYRNAGGRAHEVSEFVHQLRQNVRPNVATLCMIYNATGNNLRLFKRNSWAGTISGQFYAQVIQNGQWIGFLHVNGPFPVQVGIGGSSEGFVYLGQNNDGQLCPWLLSWRTTTSNSQNRVYTEIQQSHATPYGTNWNNISNALSSRTNNHSATNMGCFSNVTIGTGASPELVGILTLAGLNTKFMAMASDVTTIFPSLDSKYDEDGDDDATPAAADATPPA